MRLGYPTLVRAHDFDTPVPALAYRWNDHDHVLWLPGKYRRKSFARPEDMLVYHEFDQAIFRSLAPLNVNRWPCMIIHPHGGWRWERTPEGLLLIDPDGQVRLPNELIKEKTLAQIRGLKRTGVETRRDNWLQAENVSKVLHQKVKRYRLAFAVLNQPYINYSAREFITRCMTKNIEITDFEYRFLD